MEYRDLGRTGFRVSVIGFGAWAIGGQAWGGADDTESMKALHAAADRGVNFFDTADVYGDGHSERLLARLKRERSDAMVIATKAGRRLNPHVASGYNRDNLTGFVERSLVNLETDAIDLLQLHCPPDEVYDMPEVFGVLDDLVSAGKVRYYGVSVERVAEAVRAANFPAVQSVQIIFNMFRPKPAEQLFALAREKRIGILARVPLASGMLTGKFTATSHFAPTDHRAYNREGARFDQGETFSGVDYEEGLRAVEEVRALVPKGATMAQFALRWITMFPEVTAAIPGARSAQQAVENVGALELPPLTEDVMRQAGDIYDRHFRAAVHGRW